MARRRGKSHKVRGLVLLVLLLALALELWRSNRSIVTDEFRFSAPSLPETFEGTRIVTLTDLHGAEFGAGNEKLLSAVAAAQPDVIAIVGDLIDEGTKAPQDYAARLGTALCAVAPTYYVTGNHEWACGSQKTEDLKAVLSDSGVTVLTNGQAVLTRGGEEIVLAGADDFNGYADQKSPETLRAEVLSEHGECFSILLSHRDAVEYYDTLGFTLTLCGHGHGGIFRVPLLDRGVLGTNRRFFPKYDGGLYDFDGGRACFVSRGLGNIGASFRLFNPPQVAVITLQRS